MFSATSQDGRHRGLTLMASLDSINQRFGRRTVSFAAGGTRKVWALRSDQRSARFTTRWNELFRV